MKKIFTMVMALALSLAAGAQGTSGGPRKADGAIERNPQMAEHTLTPRSTMAKAPMARIRMDEGERIMGFYDTDELPFYFADGYMKLAYSGSYPVGDLFEEDVIGNFVGGEIVRFRFALASEAYVSNAFIYEVPTDYDVPSEPIAIVEINETLSDGWNDVELPEPVEIKEGTYYLIGYEYTEDRSHYPLLPDEEIDVNYVSDWGFWAYGNLGNYGTAWYYVYGYGSLCIQAVVRGGSFIDDDISLSGLSVGKYHQAGKPVDYSLNIKNSGNNVPESYTLGVEVDGDLFETLESPVGLTSSKQVLEGTLGGSLANGNHTLRVYVADINGEVPTENVGDDAVEASFAVYEGEVERQMNLIENFTSTNCTYCPYGHAVLERIQEDCPGKYAWVALHYYNSYTGDDPYYLTNGDADYIATFSELYGYPSAAFNRYMITDSELEANNEMTISLGYYPQYTEMAASQIEAMVDRYNEENPSMVSVDIATDYDKATRSLAIKVTGKGVDDARSYLDDNRLTVYITEDSLVYRQLYDGKYVDDYVHNNVLRALGCYYPWGDDINWTSDSGYENDFTVTLDGSWEWNNINVVAFISGPMAVDIGGEWYWGDMDTAFVTNANMARIRDGVVNDDEGGDVGEGDDDTGIAGPATDGKATEASRHALDGRRVSRPVKGVNIVRMSDGSTRKVVVR